MPKLIDPYEEYFMSLQDQPESISAGGSKSKKCVFMGKRILRPRFHSKTNGKPRSAKALSKAKASFGRRMDRYDVLCGNKKKTKGGLTKASFKLNRGYMQNGIRVRKVVSKKASSRAKRNSNLRPKKKASAKKGSAKKGSAKKGSAKK